MTSAHLVMQKDQVHRLISPSVPNLWERYILIPQQQQSFMLLVTYLELVECIGNAFMHHHLGRKDQSSMIVYSLKRILLCLDFRIYLWQKSCTFFDFEFRNKYYPCALVHWFDSIGDQPCPNTGMWMVEPECNDEGEPTLSVIHLNCIMQPAHLISIYDTTPIPKDLHYSDSLSAFSAFYINKFSDYHAYGLAFQFSNT